MKPPIMIVSAKNTKKTASIAQAMDSLDAALARVCFLCEILEATDENNLHLSADGINGLCMALRDIGKELASARDSL